MHLAENWYSGCIKNFHKPIINKFTKIFEQIFYIGRYTNDYEHMEMC